MCTLLLSAAAAATVTAAAPGWPWYCGPFGVGVLFGDRFDDDVLLFEVDPHISTVCRSNGSATPPTGDAWCSAF